eukprot:514118-Pleurochrysis_carterae.AAC.1
MSPWGLMRTSTSWRARRRRWPPIRRRRRQRRRRGWRPPPVLRPLPTPMVPPPFRLHAPSPRVCASLVRLRGGPRATLSLSLGASGLRMLAMSTVGADRPGAFSPSQSAPCLSLFPLLRTSMVGATRRCDYPTRM